MYHAFLMSHINYVASALVWTKTEKRKLNTLMRKSIKKVLGLPICTSSDRLDQLGMHNNIDEIIEAQVTAQVVRLSSSKAGRRILDEVGMAPRIMEERRATLSRETRATYMVGPFPRNVHPQYNEGRRKARARAILKRVRDDMDSVVFVDAAQYGNEKIFALSVIDGRGLLRSSASARAATPGIAEQIAVALALSDPERPYIYTDSREAIRAFETGNLAREAASILEKRACPGSHFITWFPAHMGKNVLEGFPNLNELAHDRARELTRRDGLEAPEGQEGTQQNDPLLTFNEITTHYQLGRRVYPLPHPKLSRDQSTTLRMLQTGSFPSRGFLSKIYSDVDPGCPDCSETFCSVAHMLWRCPALPNNLLSSEDEWEEAIRSTALRKQAQAIQRAQERAERHGVLSSTWARPAVTTASR
uniref:Putative tick transposon n=1 Tax=Rhipicephalus pulchellus TaxID=72859 RepID=L7LY09_RHIPC